MGARSDRAAAKGRYFQPGLSEAELSRRCPRGSRIAPRAERARRAAGPQGALRMKGAAAAAVAAAAAGSESKGTPWRSVACCSGCAWSAGCTETAWSLSTRAGPPSSTVFAPGSVRGNPLQSGPTTRRKGAHLPHRPGPDLVTWIFYYRLCLESFAYPCLVMGWPLADCRWLSSVH